MATPGEVLGHVPGAVAKYPSRMALKPSSTPVVLNAPAKASESPSPHILTGRAALAGSTVLTGSVSGSLSLGTTQNIQDPTNKDITDFRFPQSDILAGNISHLNTLPPNYRHNHQQSHQLLLSQPQQAQQLRQKLSQEKLDNISYTKKLLQEFSEDEILAILVQGTPASIKEFADHLYTVSTLVSENELSLVAQTQLTAKLSELTDSLSKYNTTDFMELQLHIIVERNFDIFVRLATQKFDLSVSTVAVRFLTSLFMSLNYWQTYNLMLWKPAVAHFLQVIQLDIHASYEEFIREYRKYNDRVAREALTSRDDSQDLNTGEKLAHSYRSARRSTRNAKMRRGLYLDSLSFYLEDLSSSDIDEDHDKFISNVMSGNSKVRKRSRNARNIHGLAAHKVIKKPGSSTSLANLLPILASTQDSFTTDTPKAPLSLQISNLSDSKVYSPPPAFKILNKSSNYDPDVVHECQLPSADVTNALCLRRFLRKYELIRHQETVHSKKKKLFKCFVCVKQNPAIGPRIFTRHDTLAKHIRVNHKILGKEAKAEVAYLKKHAEVVEEGDITVHVGRRKTKVDFELRAHMDKRRGSRGNESDEEFEDYD